MDLTQWVWDIKPKIDLDILGVACIEKQITISIVLLLYFFFHFYFLRH